MNTLRVIVDIDGCLADFNSAAHAILAAHSPTMKPLGPNGPDVWEWYERYGASPAGIMALEKAMQTEAFWDSLGKHADMDDDAISLLCALDEQSEISFVTARPVGRNVTKYWLLDQLYIAAPQVFLTPRRKAMALAALEPDVIIEDSARNLLDFAAAERDYQLPACHKILVDRPYNRLWHNSLSEKGATIVNSTGEALILALKGRE